MKTYVTLELKYWSDGEVYVWNYATRKETILTDTYTTVEIDRLNQEGYIVSAVYPDSRSHNTYVMTKEIEI